jgi:hypothetical protein
MAFSKRYKERALELYYQYFTKEAFQHLAKEFPETLPPDERTLRRWRKLEGITQNRIELIRQKTKVHFNQLSRVANTLLYGGLRGIKQIGNKEQEYDRYEDGYGGIGSFTMPYQDLITQLHQNIEKAYDRHRNYNLFDNFLLHLTSSISGFPNPDKADLHILANTSPMELIDTLKILAHQKDFMGKCPACKDSGVEK